MPLSRQEKEQLLDSYQHGLVKAPHVVLMGYKGITVMQATELRRRVREIGGKYAVIKNRLALRAIDGKPLSHLKEYFEGPTAAAFSERDPVGLAKAISEFAKEVPAIEVKAGLLEGKPIPAADVNQIAELPGREALISKLVYVLQSPIWRLVQTLAVMPRQLVVVLSQIGQQREGSASDG